MALFGPLSQDAELCTRRCRLGRGRRSAATRRQAGGRVLHGGQLHGGVYKGDHDTPVLGGFIKIEIQRQGTNPTNGVWQDVTGEVLALGIAGRNLADSQRRHARQSMEQASLTVRAAERRLPRTES